MGGPNLHLDVDRFEGFMRSNPDLDICVMGEGEIPSADIISKYIESKNNIDIFKQNNIQSTSFIRTNGEFYYGLYDNSSRDNIIRDLNDIPSPWLNGSLDRFFDGNLAPIIETTRGCPFKCLFCVQGTDHYRNVRRFSHKRIQKEIVYIAKRMKKHSKNVGYLRIADSNFGMFKQDVEISKTIKHVKNKYGWPKFIDATTGKNKKDSILETVGNLEGSLVMYNSVQSLDPIVLENVKRKNISYEVMRQVQIDAAEMGVKTLTETILSLPGETFKSHKEGIYQLMRMGIKQFTNYQCMLLKGSEMETNESRKTFSFNTYFRVLPRSFGVYSDERIVEVEEVITSTSTLSFEEYLNSRRLHLIFIIYYNGLRFKPLIKFLSIYKIDIEEWFDKLLLNIDFSDDLKITSLFSDFIMETREELFDSKDECFDFYTKEDNFNDFINGKIGGNLLMKYFSIATFYSWKSIVNHAVECAISLLKERNANYHKEFINNIHIYMDSLLASGRKSDEILSSNCVHMIYDIAKWIDDEFNCIFEEYKLPNGVYAEFSLSKNNLEILKGAIDVYGDDIIGLSKLVTRVQYSDQIMECRLIDS